MSPVLKKADKLNLSLSYIQINCQDKTQQAEVFITS